MCIRCPVLFLPLLGRSAREFIHAPPVSGRQATTSQKPHLNQHSGLQVGLQIWDDILQVMSSVLRGTGPRLLLSLLHEGPTAAPNRAGTCPAPHTTLGDRP